MSVSIAEIIKKIEPYIKDGEAIELVRSAYNYSSLAHTGQKRKSGAPFIDHPMHVVLILAQLRMDAATLAAAMLHDTVEDTQVSLDDIQKNFSREIAELVDGVTKISHISFSQKHEAQAESFRKMLLAMAKDIRVIMIKLADRLHNMRTLRHMKENKQLQIAQETLDIYAPLANRLGISWMKIELEDLSFRYSKPMAYHRISRKLSKTQKSREKYINRVIKMLQEEVNRYKLDSAISGRHKHIFSIYRKMEKRGLDFDEITDILAFRIILKSVQDCYETLGLVHSLWKPVPGKFKDYIAMPKANLYQSLHTTVVGPEGELVEVQIRTEEMHAVAEEGIAAHWAYKEHKGVDARDQQKFAWLRSMVEWEQDLQGSAEFIETVKLDLFADAVYVFTPRGEVRELPRGSSPIDFAFAIHSEVGEHCVGARVNGKMVPLRYKLQNGDRVEVITSETQKPNKDWLSMVATSKAKAKIRAHLRTQERETGIAIGRNLLDGELKQYNLTSSQLQKQHVLGKVSHELGLRGEDDLFAAIGFGKQPLPKVINKIDHHVSLSESSSHETSLLKSLVEKVTRKSKSPIRVDGLDGVMVRFGKCCSPIPGDQIIGFITRGRGVTIHRTECKRVLESNEDRRVEVAWDETGRNLHPAQVRVLTVDTPGLLASISKEISTAGANISGVTVSQLPGKKASINFVLQIANRNQLFAIMKAIEEIDGVISAERIRN